jgi:hypothetical protein
MISEAMIRRLKAACAGCAVAVGSLFVSIPATVITASRLRSTQVDSMRTDHGGLEFQAAYVDVSLLPALVAAMLTFVVAFMWMLRRPATKQ